MDIDASDDCLEMIDMNSNLVSVPEDEERCPTLVNVSIHPRTPLSGLVKI